jgi:uncharacterized protein (DUF2249 family)
MAGRTKEGDGEMILAIDPGSTESAYVLLRKEDLSISSFGKLENGVILEIIQDKYFDHVAIEMVASYGMAVGVEVFETVFWIGRFYEAARSTECKYIQKIYRKDEKMNLCHSMKAKDANIRQALIDRFGTVGTKKAPGWFYGVSKDVWAAIAVGVTYYDMYIKDGAK